VCQQLRFVHIQANRALPTAGLAPAERLSASRSCDIDPFSHDTIIHSSRLFNVCEVSMTMTQKYLLINAERHALFAGWDYSLLDATDLGLWQECSILLMCSRRLVQGFPRSSLGLAAEDRQASTSFILAEETRSLPTPVR